MSLQYTKNSDGTFLCPHCPYTARIQSTMHYHLKKHEGALPHACKHCNQKFLQKGLLDLHVSARHQETIQIKQDKFKCPCKTCEYEDIRKGNRLIHFLRIHLKDITDGLKTKTTEPNCVTDCSQCKKSFKSITQFYYHASSCVNPSETHPLYSEWISLKS